MHSLYSYDRIFKIGSTERLVSRITQYNTGRPVEDEYYYIWAARCYNSKDLDTHIQKMLSMFKYSKNQELYHGIKFIDLSAIVQFLIDNYDKSVEFITNFIKTRLEQSMEEEEDKLKFGI